MTVHTRSASTASSASIVLPTAQVISLPTAKRKPKSLGFTKVTTNKMHCPPGQTEAFFWDTSCRGFGMRALSSGRRSWIYQYRDAHKSTRRIVLGDVSAVSLEAARDAARRHAASVTQGANPSAERKAKRAAVKVLGVIDAYLRHAKTRQRPRSYQETERHLRRHASPLHHEPAEAVHRRDVTELLERVASESGPIAANRLRAALSRLWSWALQTGVIESDASPVALTLRQPEKPRTRTLSDTELKTIWEATSDGGDYCRIVRLCLLTGCRREEMGGLRRDELHDDRIVIAAERMKGAIEHEVSLLPMIAAALPDRPEQPDGCCVFGRKHTGFSGWSKSKEDLDARIAAAGLQMPPWRLHDLRRTFSTRLHDAGVQPIVVEALLAHKQQGVAAVYNRASFREAKRAALTRWHSIVAGIVGVDLVIQA
jgi:integrase